MCQNVEWRLSIYGRSVHEWDKLAKWIVNNKLFSHNVRWLIQVPRLYDIYKANGSVETFEDIVTSPYKERLFWVFTHISLQMCSDLYLRWLRTHNLTQSCTSSSSAWLVSTLWMMNLKWNDVFIKNSLILAYGTFNSLHHIPTGAFQRCSITLC